jgi:hypothetical protein
MIPFKSLSYEPGQTTWGFDVARRIYHKNERVHWSGFNPALDFTDVSMSGDLEGIENVSQGIGLDVQVYGALRAKHDWQLKGDGAGLSATAWRQRLLQGDPRRSPTRSRSIPISPMRRWTSGKSTRRASRCSRRKRAISSYKTCRHLSSAAEVLAGISQDRVSKQWAAVFLAQYRLGAGTAGKPCCRRQALRTICRVRCRRVQRANRQDAGRQRRTGVVVARVTHPVLAESKVGFVLTNGDPTGNTDNTVAGVDFQYRNSNLFGDKVLQADAYYMKSFSSTAKDDESGSASAQLS